MKASQAVVVHGANDIRIESGPVAPARTDEALVAIAYGGICGSDLHYWQHGAAGESVLKAPMRLGHEASGTVVVAASDGSGPAVGTAVAIHPATPGGTGAKYPTDRPNLSPGCRYMGSAAQTPHNPPACSDRCPRVSTSGWHRWPNPPALPGTPCQGRATSRARLSW